LLGISPRLRPLPRPLDSRFSPVSIRWHFRLIQVVDLINESRLWTTSSTSSTPPTPHTPNFLLRLLFCLSVSLSVRVGFETGIFFFYKRLFADSAGRVALLAPVFLVVVEAREGAPSGLAPDSSTDEFH